MSYRVTYHGFTVAESSLTLVRRDADTWVYTSRTATRGLASFFSGPPGMESVLRVTDGGVQPLTFRSGALTAAPPTPADIHVTFDWATGRVSGVYKDAPVNMTVPPGTQDDLSVQIALVTELMRGHTPETFFLLDQKTADKYHYQREKEEVLDTRIGRIPTIVFKSTKVDAARTTRFWCAPAYGYVPLRVEEKTDDGSQFTLMVDRAKRD